ncbi:hypothetical protein NBRC116586_08360 [Pseudooceanicola nitratireducens]|uniref:DUF7146 domain-containing protein n=1 Tax=Pseudooceanicola nitratireducens TaxID=517719 RepID=UPI00310BD3C4
MLSAKQITQALGGTWHGRYGLAFCPAHHNTRTPALSLKDGDDGRLLAYCHVGCRFGDIMSALRSTGMFDDTLLIAPQSRQRDMADTAKAENEKREQRASACWQEASSIHGTLAHSYLHSRGIPGPLPASLRFHPHCWHGPTARRYPAMIGLISGPNGMAVHRTYLAPDGLSKATCTPNRMMLGRTAGGGVHLTDAPGPLILAEGIETALSLASGLLPSTGIIWAALSTSGMAGFDLPRQAGRLIIATDGDRPGRDAGDTLGNRALAAGWEVSLLPAPEGKDWNDVLMGRGLFT